MSNVQMIIKKQHAFFATGKTKDIRVRIAKLQLLKRTIKKYEAKISAALKADLNKSPFEAYETEIGIVQEEIDFALKHVKRWSRPKCVPTPIVHFPASSHLYAEPYGTVLIMSPWNYPFQLTIAPLAAAIAAGNCAVIKPSAYSMKTAEVIEQILAEVFSEAYVAVVQGGREANQTLMHQKFDYIFFTGSPAVGKEVMRAAAANLTPVTLELGGKSPCIVDETADIRLAAKRIVWGKCLNAGQTCVAPDYILVHQNVKEQLVQEMKGYVKGFYGSSPETNKDYPKIINQRHFARLVGLMEEGRVLEGGRTNEITRQIAPTIMDQITWDSPIMQEEIFGPLLPVLTFADFKATIKMLGDHPEPLAFYLFTTSKQNEIYAMRTAAFGGGCINDTVIHLANPHLPFSGVGNSGMGQYHGKAGFDTFTHQKSVVRKSNLLDIYLRYPPFKNNLKLLKLFLK